jgi:hypothetical protein
LDDWNQGQSVWIIRARGLRTDVPGFAAHSEVTSKLLDHLKLAYRSQGRDFRLTDVHGNVVKGVLA